jgi:hypothetical protein
VSRVCPSKKVSLLTPRVRAAQYELISALKESVEASGADRDQAEGSLSKVMAEIWNEAEAITRRMPQRAGIRVIRQRDELMDSVKA